MLLLVLRDCFAPKLEGIVIFLDNNFKYFLIYRESSTYDVDPFLRRGVTRISV